MATVLTAPLSLLRFGAALAVHPGAAGAAVRPLPRPAKALPEAAKPAAVAPFSSSSSSHPAPPAPTSAPPGPNSAAGLVGKYSNLVQEGVLKPDPRQASCVDRLQRLSDELVEYKSRVALHNEEVHAFQTKRNTLLAELEQRERGKDDTSSSPQGSAWMHRLMGAVGLSSPSQPLSPQQQKALARRRRERKVDGELGPPPQPPQPPTGVYIHGSVGSGKSLVMDLFYNSLAECEVLPFHRRVHFNAAMLEMHSWMTKIEQHRGRTGASEIDHQAIEGIEESYEGAAAEGKDAGRNAVIALRRATRQLALNPRQQAERLARSNASVIRRAARAVIRNHLDMASLGKSDKGQPVIPSLLCFDELQVTDVFAAVALKGLLEVLTSEGTVMVMTSNRAPAELNSQGLHEELFNHFVDSLANTCDTVEISSGNDYRKMIYDSQKHKSLDLYHTPLGPGTDTAIEDLWLNMTVDGRPQEVEVMFGRQLPVPAACRGTARFAFCDLCAKTLGAADYIALSRAFHTVFITDIPAFSMQIRDQARRFITLVDELYNHRVRLICSAQESPDRLFTHTEGSEEAILDLMDLESLQSETAVAGSGLRRDVLADGGVAPVATTTQAMAAATHHLTGMEERFAFRRAVSRLYEMQTGLYLSSRSRH